MKLSKHFIDRWRERVKTPVPTAKEVEGMINESLLLQRHRDVYTPRGRHIRILALYWMIDEGLIVKIDEKVNVAVTVLTSDTIDEEAA